MRIALLLAPCALLAGCGGESADDFSVAVKRSPEAVYSELSRLSGNALTAPLALDPISREKTGDGEMTFTIPADAGHEAGTLRLRVAEAKGGSSTVGVMLDLPYITRRSGISGQYLSETKAERVVRASLDRWAKSYGMGSSATSEFGDLDMTLGALAVATQKFDKLGDTEALLAGADFSKFEATGDADGGWSRNEVAAADGSPMSDPSDDIGYGEPSDDATGTGSSYASYEESDWAEE